MELSRQYWSGLPFHSLGDLPDPWTELGSPALQADSLPSEPPGWSPWVVERIKPDVGQAQHRVRNTCLLLLSSVVMIASQVHPRGGGNPSPLDPSAPFLGTLGSPLSSCELPKQAPAHSAFPGGWHRTRREQEAGTGGQLPRERGWRVRLA